MQRIKLNINAAGSFRPGSPIQVVVTARGNLVARDANLIVVLLDQEGESRNQNGSPTSPRKLGRWAGDLPGGSQRQLSTSVTFDRPGYYRIYAQVKSAADPGEKRAARDTLVYDVSDATLWLLIDEEGGRLTEGFDSLAAYGNGRQPKFGPYGPFVSMSSAARSSGASANTLMTADRVYGYIKKYDLDLNMTVGVPNTLVRLTCYDNWVSAEAFYDTFTDANGYFDITCSPAQPGEMMSRLTWYLYNSVAEIRTPSESYSAGSTYLVGGSPLYYEGYVPNNHSAHVFKQLNEKVPIAVQRFGRSLSRTVVRVHQSDTTYGPRYWRDSDRIDTNVPAVLGQAGWFSTTHELGHRYHYVAIDPWTGLGCGASHSYTGQENLSCAFSEGFADFFGMWIAGDRLGTIPFGGDWGLENNTTGVVLTNPPPSGDGVLVEASVAAFLYDLVDGYYEPDAPNGFPGNAEAWDTVQYPASWLANVMHYCRLEYTITRLDGADELIYCLERDTTARAESLNWSSAWRNFNVVTFEQFVATYDKASIRGLWKYNLYGVQ